MAFWITLVRGMLAITLGLALAFQPDIARPMLGNYMGIYWLVSGFISLRWGVHGERTRGLPVLAGAVGVLAGLAMLGRSFTRGWASEELFISVLGAIILLTGLMHASGGFRSGQRDASPDGEPGLRARLLAWPWTAVLLGIFEIVLGVLLIVSPASRGPALHLVAGIWALVGGAILIGDALRLRRARQRRTHLSQATESAREAEPMGEG